MKSSKILLALINSKLDLLTHKVEQLMATEAEELSKLADISLVLDKISGETTASLAEIARLQALIAAQPPGAIPQAIVDAVDAVAAKVGNIDALVPDAVV